MAAQSEPTANTATQTEIRVAVLGRRARREDRRRGAI